MTDIAIRVENLSKLYRIGARQAAYKTLRESLTNAVTAPFRRFRRSSQSAIRNPQSDEFIWALKDVSFEVKQGEVVGIIGRNGAGKTTLLKVLSRITEPTEGWAEIHGRVGSLLEVGTGFHPELTGRENITLNGAILGMKKAEIERKFDEIVAFAEIEKFIDTPVKYYSSGMYVRLAFAVAAHLEPEILLVDEVLAVGDAAFQKKCLGKMGDVAQEGRTVLFVSHNIAAIETLCERVVLLDAGNVVRQGDSQQVISYYLASHLTLAMSVPVYDRIDRRGDGRVRFTSFHLEDVAGKRIRLAKTGQTCRFVFGYETHDQQPKSNVVASFTIHDQHDRSIMIQRTNMTGRNFDDIPPRGYFVCEIENFPIVYGSYTVDCFAAINEIIADWVQTAAQIEVLQGDFFGTGHPGMPAHAKVLVKGSWHLLSN